MVRRIVRRFVQPWMHGAIDYFRHPELRGAWGGPFNGQTRRQEFFCALVKAIPFDAIVETGTFRGTTTEFMAKTFGGRIYSVETDPYVYGFARARFALNPRVRLARGDSRTTVAMWLNRGLGKKVVLFYLDAHWEADLPLVEELDLILGRCRNAVILIDDFQVPWDTGYGFDDYGGGKALTPGYVASVVKAHGAAVYFPTIPSSEDTGVRRGWTVIAAAADLVATLDSMEAIRRWDPSHSV